MKINWLLNQTHRIKLTLLCLSLVTILTTPARAGQIAITFDDAPLAGSKLMSGTSKTEKIIQHLKQNQVQDALFFVTTNNISDQNAHARLKAYTDAGFHLAHHSHKHISATKSEVSDYLEDFDQAHQKLKQYEGVLKLHRFPFLHYGADHKSRKEIRQHIIKKQYGIGYVTVDNFDWYINSKLVSAHQQGKNIDYKQLSKLYVDTLWQAINFYDDKAQTLLGRSPKHVLLLHENEAAALFLGDLIKHIKQHGWEIISPQQAYSDPIANADLDKLEFNKQGRIAALAYQQGTAKKQLRHPAENTKYLDKLFEQYGVFTD